jgi:hypothetical protein
LEAAHPPRDCLVARCAPRNSFFLIRINELNRIGRERQAKSWELRTATSYAQQMRDQARDLLAPVHGWFTEGFVTPGLEEATTLLSQLA